MPSATRELHDKVKALTQTEALSDGPAVDWLTVRGWRLLRGFVWAPPPGKPQDNLTNDEVAVIQWLIDEWDYGGIEWP